MQQLASDKTLSERQRELELFEKDIQLLEQEADGITRDSREEHDRAARHRVDQIKTQLIRPLAELKADIEAQVDSRYVENMIARKVSPIGLPETLKQAFERVSQTFDEVWEVQKDDLMQTLDGLRTNYSSQMEKQIGTIKAELGQMDISIPALDVSFSLDFSEIEQYQRQRTELEQQIAEQRKKVEELEDDMDKHRSSEAQINLAREALARGERQIERLGPQPAVVTRTDSKKTRDKIWLWPWSEDKYVPFTYTDDSELKNWNNQREKLFERQNRDEDRLKEIMLEEERKTGMRMSLERARKKYEKECANLEKEQRKQEQKLQESHAHFVHDTLQRLLKSTTGQLDQRIDSLENHVAQTIPSVFQSQLTALETCVREQYLEPLNAKRAKRAEIQALLQKSQADIAAHTARLQQGQKDIEELAQLTLNALQTREV